MQGRLWKQARKAPSEPARMRKENRPHARAQPSCILQRRRKPATAGSREKRGYAVPISPRNMKDRSRYRRRQGAGYETLLTQQVMDDTSVEEEEAEKSQPFPLAKWDGTETSGGVAGQATASPAGEKGKKPERGQYVRL